MRGRLRLDDFVVRKVNWQSKADNLEQILNELNLLSRNVVFVDDNPLERAEVSAAFPDTRVLGAHPYQLKRFSVGVRNPGALVSSESSPWTEMMQGQMARERERKRVSRGKFLGDLGIEVPRL